MALLSLYYSYDYLLYASKKYSFEVFDRCVKYDSITEIYLIYRNRDSLLNTYFQIASTNNYIILHYLLLWQQLVPD